MFVNLTFHVNTTSTVVGPKGIFHGGGIFGDAQAHALSDDDGDGVWSVTLSVASGLGGNYQFFNSPYNGQDWDAGENFFDLDCADVDGNHRILGPLA